MNARTELHSNSARTELFANLIKVVSKEYANILLNQYRSECRADLLQEQLDEIRRKRLEAMTIGPYLTGPIEIDTNGINDKKL